MTSSDPIKAAWQASVTEAALPAPDTLRAGADRFYRVVRNRNRVEYGAALFVVVAFAAIAVFAPSPATQVGAVLVILGTLLVVWQLYRRASASPTPGDAGALPLLVHQRAQIVRQRDALAQVGLWYLAPLVPGMLMILTAPGFDFGFHVLGWSDAARIAGFFAIFGGVWWLNHRAARQLQRAIDEIDALQRGG